MASASEDLSATPADPDASATQPSGNPPVARAEAEDGPALVAQCVALGITARDLDLELNSIEDALAAMKLELGARDTDVGLARERHV